MPGNIDPSLPFTDHFAEYGYAIVPGLVDQSFCQAALRRVQAIVKHDLPLDQWTAKNTPVLHQPYFEDGNPGDEVFEQLFEQPRLREAIEAMYGGPGHWDQMKNYYLFIKPYNPEGTAKLSPRGHIDFPSQGVPPLYRGFTFQMLLADNEPFSGNLTVHPGTHKLVQKMLIDDPGQQFPGGVLETIPQPPPVEFVGKAGDVCFMHHLIFHSGNESHSEHHLPRVGIHAEAFRQEWLTQIDPFRPNLSPWERSLAHNGPFKTTPDLEVENMKKRREYVESLRTKGGELATARY